MTFIAVRLALYCALFIAPSLFLLPCTHAFVPLLVPIQNARQLSVLGMGASLSRTNDGASGDEILEIASEGLTLEGCVVNESGGRYYCTADDDGGASIGGQSLTAGVRYGLNEGMTIRTRAGKEYEVKIEGGAPTGDAAMSMMFGAMQAGFANAEEEE